MANQAYTRAELEKFGGGLPDKRLVCEKCATFIPQFADLSERDGARIKQLAGARPVLALKELTLLTGCSMRFAEIRVSHEGTPELLYDYRCRFCGEPLRNSEARQCRSCKRDRHDEKQLKRLKQSQIQVPIRLTMTGRRDAKKSLCNARQIMR